MLAAGALGDLAAPVSYLLANLEFLDAELCRHEDDLPTGRSEELRHCLREALLGAERIRDILDDLPASGGRKRRDPRVDLHRVLITAIKMARMEIDHRARVITEFDVLPPIHGSESRLGRLFLNLLVNAAQAVAGDPENEHFIRVVTRNETEQRVSVEITDSGPGIAPELLPRIFEPFFTTKPAGQGTGLGLAVCRQVVDDLGGTLTAESVPGRGATFRVVLPVGRHAHGDEPKDSAGHFAPSSPPVRRLPFRKLG